MLLFDAIYGLVSLSTPISLERRRSSVNDGQAKPLDMLLICCCSLLLP